MTTFKMTAKTDAAAKTSPGICFVDMIYGGKKGGPFTARVNLSVKGRLESNYWQSKTGLFDAIATAIRNSVAHEGKLVTYEIFASTSGTAGNAHVKIILKNAKGEFEGHGSDTDTPTASALAYIDALNKMLT
jgi:hypothetical protein